MDEWGNVTGVEADDKPYLYYRVKLTQLLWECLLGQALS